MGRPRKTQVVIIETPKVEPTPALFTACWATDHGFADRCKCPGQANGVKCSHFCHDDLNSEAPW